MMNVLADFLLEWDKFLILLARFSGITFIPVFNTRNIPTQWRISVLMMITLFAWFMDLAETVPADLPLPVFFLTIATEVLTGIALALVIQFIFAGIQLAGQLIDTQMGFGIMNVVDPLSGTQAPILGNFKYVLALLVFLQIDGHHYFIKALFDSYETIPVGQCFFLSPYFMQSYIGYFGEIFTIGCKLSMPIVGTLLVTDFVMGIMARTVPQMNIFMVGMPVKIIIGFIVLVTTIPLYVYLLNTSFAGTINKIYNLLSL
jgi:flagellar biosynthetic protein FliR